MSDSATNLIVKGTFALLLLGSVITWALVLVKARQRWLTRMQDNHFLRAVKAPLRFSTLSRLTNEKGPTWRVTQAGLKAIEEASGAGGTEQDESPREAAERALQSQIHAERRTAESGLAVLASIGTTSPFVGLFGTVWGIIHALKAIGHSGSASLEIVAGPIGEALVATGLGIAVAVPAVLAYNFFTRQLKVQIADFDQYGAVFLAGVLRGADTALSSVESVPVSTPARKGELREASA